MAPVLIIGLLMGFAIMSFGFVWLLVVAWSEGEIHGISSFLFPPYAVFYAFTRWCLCRTPFRITVLGLVITVICGCMTVVL